MALFTSLHPKLLFVYSPALFENFSKPWLLCDFKYTGMMKSLLNLKERDFALFLKDILGRIKGNCSE